MSLPTENVVFPPEEARRSYSLIREWASWWSGDTNEIQSFYSGTSTAVDGSTRRRPFMFWARRGRRDGGGGTEAKLHVPVAGDLCTFSADLLFAQEPEFLVPDGDANRAAQDRLDEIVQAGDVFSTLIEGAETAAALGGVYLRPVWDQDLLDVPFLSIVHPDRAIPEWSWGRLRAVTFWEELKPSDVQEKAGVVVRHLERHSVEAGRLVIEHGLYFGSKGKLGEMVPLGSHPSTEGLVAGAGEGSLEGNVFRVVVDGQDRLDVEYVPNMRPNRRSRGSAEGRSDLEGLEGVLDAIDESWTSLLRDVRLSASRIIVPGEFLEKRGRGSGASFDLDSEVFTPLEIDPSNADRAGITLNQFEIRTESHVAAIMALFERAVDSAGYSPQSFGLQIEGRAESGTALRMRLSKTLSTQAKKRRYWGPRVERVLETLLVFDRFVFGGNVEPVRPEIVWPDTTAPDMSQTSETLERLKRAQSASVRTRVEILHPDWSSEDVDVEVEAIMGEEGLVVETPEQVGEVDVPVPGFGPVRDSSEPADTMNE